MVVGPLEIDQGLQWLVNFGILIPQDWLLPQTKNKSFLPEFCVRYKFVF